jgi:hypothetical protein
MVRLLGYQMMSAAKHNTVHSETKTTTNIEQYLLYDTVQLWVQTFALLTFCAVQQ